MSKTIVLGDMHIGCRNFLLPVAEFHLKFFEQQLFPYMKSEGINRILQVGDMFDVRKMSNHVILDLWKKRFFDYLKNNNIRLDMLLGNHDLALRHSLKVNSPELFLEDYSNVFIYKEPTIVDFNGLDILMVPWLCNENNNECISEISKTKASWVAGHFEIGGFQMHLGQPAFQDGLDRKIFDRFDTVLSGHFHTRSSDGTINYVGTPYEMTWIDYGDAKGFHVLESKNKSLTFIRNEHTLFHKIIYDDKDSDSKYWKTIDISGLDQTYAKVIVVHKTDTKQFDKLMNELNKINFLSLEVVEDLSDLEADSVDDSAIVLEDTKTLISSYIDNSDFELEKPRLKSDMVSLYVEALNILE